eukprot:5141862-Amphidinium_carterae.1
MAVSRLPIACLQKNIIAVQVSVVSHPMLLELLSLYLFHELVFLLLKLEDLVHIRVAPVANGGDHASSCVIFIPDPGHMNKSVSGIKLVLWVWSGFTSMTSLLDARNRS